MYDLHMNMTEYYKISEGKISNDELYVYIYPMLNDDTSIQ